MRKFNTHRRVRQDMDVVSTDAIDGTEAIEDVFLILTAKSS